MKPVQDLVRAFRADPSFLLLSILIPTAGIIALALSFRWGVRNDLPILMYAGRLAVTGARAPFADVFDMNQPFALLAYGLLDALVGPNDRVLRFIDGCLVVAVACSLGSALRTPRWIVGPIAGGLFAIWHLHDAGVDALQREMLVLGLIALGGLALTRQRWALAGAMMGFAALVKVHSTPFFVVLLALHAHPLPTPMRWRAAGRFSIGVTVGLGLVLTWVASVGGLTGWWWLITEYVPLYGSQAGTLTFESDPIVRWTRIWGWASSLHTHPATWFAPVALWLAFRTKPRTTARHSALGAGALWALGWAYVVVAGVFWPYHQTPAITFGSVLVALVLAIPQTQLRAGKIEIIAARLGALFLAWQAIGWPLSDLDTQLARDGRNAHALRAATWFETELGPGQTVQPLDVVAGVVDGMWRADAPLATPVLYDFMLYHHVDTPVIRTIRSRFLEAFEEPNPPDWVVRPHVGRRMRTAGPLSVGTFPELETILSRDYRVVHDDGMFLYYGRREGRSEL